MQKNKAFTLIETIAFIVIISVVLTGLLFSLKQFVSQKVSLNELTTAENLAKQRMELILGQRNIFGFSNFYDPCLMNNSSPACELPNGFNITQPTIINNNKNEKIIRIQVTGLAQAVLITRVYNYENPD